MFLRHRFAPTSALLVARLCLLALLAGCGVELAVPPTATILCETDAHCPKDFVCKESLGRCVREGAEDTVPEVPTASITPPQQFVKLGAAARVTFEVTKLLGVTPSVSLQWSGASPTDRQMTMESHDEAARRYTYAYVAANGDPQAWASVVIRVVDNDGNQGRGEQTRSVLFDFQAPALATDVQGAPLASVQLIPAADNLQRNVTAITTGTVARVAFTVDEPLAAQPTVRLSDDAVTGLSLVSHAGLSYVYEVLWSSAVEEERAYDVTALLVDQAGNENDVPVGTLSIDTVAPAPPTVDAPNAVVFERVPWGSATTTATPAFALRGSAGAATSATEVIAYAAPQVFLASGAYVGREVTRAPIRPDGSFGGALGTASALQLPMSDRADLYVLAMDAAGNLSDAFTGAGIEATRVRDVAWTATLLGKVPGSSLQNPHAFELRHWFGDALVQGDSVPLASVALVGNADGAAVTTIGESSWRNVTPTYPGMRGSVALSYDSFRGNYVMWGGAGYFSCDGVSGPCGLWEGRGLRWSVPTPTDPEGDGAPERTGSASTAFDSGRGVTVAFDGTTLWEWNGVSWKFGTSSSSISPSPTAEARLVYDRAHRRVLLFGGSTSNLWEYDGATLRVLCGAGATCPGPKPTPRHDHAFAYDSARNVAVLFGGELAAGGLTNETWEWNGAAWSPRCTGAPCSLTVPSTRAGHGLAYDADRAVTVLFGGRPASDCAGDPCGPRDTWEWNGEAWEPACTGGACLAASPDGRSEFGMVYDPNRQRVIAAFGSVLPGGSMCDETPIFCNGIWEWDGAGWTRLDSDQPSPGARSGVALTVDPASNRVLLFGGATTNNSCWNTSPSLLNDTWQWNGDRWNKLSPATSPAARCGHSLATFTPLLAAPAVVLFGGTTGAATDGTTWLWNGTTWTRRCEGVPAGDTCAAVAARQGAAMGRGAPGDRVLLFGGSSDTDDGVPVEVNTDYTWTTSAWGQVCIAAGCTSSRPVTRFGAAMAYDPSSGTTVLFGGSTSAGDVLNDTWRWGGSTWSLAHAGGASAPPVRGLAGLAYAPERGALVLFGGSFTAPVIEVPLCTGTSSVCDDTWELRGATWTRRAPVDPDRDGQPTSYFSPHQPFLTPMSPEPISGHLLMYNERHGETWLYDTGGQARPGHVFAVSFDAAQAPAGRSIVDIQVRWTGGGLGAPLGTSTPGAVLSMWDGERWVTLTSDANASPTSVRSMTWTLSSDATFNQMPTATRDVFFVGAAQTLYLALTPSAPGGAGTTLGTVVSDYVEATVAYRLP